MIFDRIWNAVSYVSMLILEVIFHTAIVLFCMYSLNWKLALIPTLAMLITGSIAILEERRLGDIYEDISEENAALNTVAEENLAGVRTVKAFARGKIRNRQIPFTQQPLLRAEYASVQGFRKILSVFFTDHQAAAAHRAALRRKPCYQRAGSPSAA